MKPDLAQILTLLQTTRTLLETMGRPGVWMMPGPELPAHLLLVNLEVSEQTYTLQLLCLDEWLSLPVDNPAAPWLQFSVLMPLQSAEADLLSLAQLLIRINQVLPLGSLGLNEANGVHYSYRLPLSEGIGPVQLVQIVQMMEFGLTIAPKLIAEVIEGRLTVSNAQLQLEQELVRLAHTRPQPS